jgi:chromosome partitioning protein
MTRHRVRLTSIFNMQRITIINVKGGCGKTTIATNLASAYATRGLTTTLIDYDPQGSSIYWLNLRPETASKINGIAAYPSNKPVTRSWQLRLPPETERVIVDTPAGIKGLDLVDQLRGTHTILIPVLPSSIDTHATADFIRDLYLIAKVKPTSTRLCIVCNRVKPNTLAFTALQRFLDVLHIPVIAQLRETQHYNKSSELGLGIHELALADNRDRSDWQHMIDWLEVPSPAPQLQLA